MEHNLTIAEGHNLNITTRKEKLLARIYELNNQLRALRGEAPVEIFPYDFYREADNAYESDLRERLERLPVIIEEQKKENERKAKTEAYYKTDEGAARLAALQARKDDEVAAVQRFKDDCLAVMKAWIKDFLGDHWTVEYMYPKRVTFHIWDADTNQRVFGSDIEVCVDRCGLFGKEEFSTNIGAMGSFDILDCSTAARARFYIDLGRFLGDTNKMEELRGMMYAYEDGYQARVESIRALNDEMENPLGL